MANIHTHNVTQIIESIPSLLEEAQYGIRLLREENQECLVAVTSLRRANESLQQNLV